MDAGKSNKCWAIRNEWGPQDLKSSFSKLQIPTHAPEILCPMAQAGSREGKGEGSPQSRASPHFSLTAAKHEEYFCLIQFFFKKSNVFI